MLNGQCRGHIALCIVLKREKKVMPVVSTYIIMDENNIFKIKRVIYTKGKRVYYYYYHIIIRL